MITNRIKQNSIQFFPISYSDFKQLSKPGLLLSVIITSIIGMIFALNGQSVDWSSFLLLSLGVFLCGAGAHFWNQLLERENDALMERTKNRPLPTGRVTVTDVASIGVFFMFWGFVTLYLAFNTLTAFLAFLTCILYIAVYTPLKTRTVFNTWIGAFPGAIPPLIGWAAVSNELPIESYVLFAIVYVWQIPHFLALAWKYREQYQIAGFKMVTGFDKTGRSTALQIILHSFFLFQISLLPPAVFDNLGIIYYIGALVLGSVFLRKSLRFYFDNSEDKAMNIFMHSVIYLPILLDRQSVV